MPPSLDIIIVNWNAGQQLSDCLESIVSARWVGFTLGSVVVIGNASNDGSLDGLDVLVLKLPRNVTEKLFRQILVVGAVIVIGTFFIILIFPLSVAMWNHLGTHYRLGFLGVQSIVGKFFSNVYYRWSMWLITAFILSVGRYNIAALVIGIAIVITLSTSVIMFSLLGLLLLIFALGIKPVNSVKFVIFLVMLFIVVAMVAVMFSEVAGVVFENVVSKFSASTESTAIKLGHIEGILQSMQESTMNLMFGMGVGAEFYSPSLRTYTIDVEVSHFNFLRQFGLIGGFIFFGYILYVITKAYQTDMIGKRWSIGLLMLFVAAGTNPLLMSPVFMVVLIVVRAYVLRFRMEKLYGI